MRFLLQSIGCFHYLDKRTINGKTKIATRAVAIPAPCIFCATTGFFTETDPPNRVIVKIESQTCAYKYGSFMFHSLPDKALSDQCQDAKKYGKASGYQDGH